MCDHGIYIRWKLNHKAQPLLFILFKAIHKIERRHKSDFFFSKKAYFPSFVRNMLPSNISTKCVTIFHC